MPQGMSSTIFAPATAPGRAGVAVLRLSGPAVMSVAAALLRPANPHLPPRRAVLRQVIDPATGEAIDQGLALFFPGPASFTGEDVLELHLHGSRAVLDRMMLLLAAQPGCRLAEPGEFTRRAFDYGKLDLTEVEGLADLIAAETEAQRRQALSQLSGDLGRLYSGWAERLARCLAFLEADIDFVDEADVPEDLAAAQDAPLIALHAEISRHLADGRRGERLRDGLTVAILGAPNAGKSSLLNALAGRQAAIVSARAGTTRDVLEVALDLGGYPFVLIDTAGLRDATDEIEQEGIRRALDRAQRADIVLALVDAAEAPQMAPEVAVALEAAHQAGASILRIASKCDTAPDLALPADWLALSTATGDGVENLILRLIAMAADLTAARSGSGPSWTRARHREALVDVVAALDRALQAPYADLRAEDVRLAMRALGRITGRVDVENLLDIVFREFCIGK